MIFPCRGRGPRLRHAAIMEEASVHDILIDGNRDTLEMQWKEISFRFAVAAAGWARNSKNAVEWIFALQSLI